MGEPSQTSPSGVGLAGPILLFDGECNLCNGFVQFVLRHERSARIRFASLQSDAGGALAKKFGVDTAAADTLVFIDDGHAYLRSDGALRLARFLDRPWSAASVLRVVPRPIRDGIYRFVANHRHQWFGKPAECFVPTPDLRARFLDAYG
jgi:predicted DCC family thiol-disulfide oxidoreductase YuxK